MFLLGAWQRFSQGARRRGAPRRHVHGEHRWEHIFMGRAFCRLEELLLLLLLHPPPRATGLDCRLQKHQYAPVPNNLACGAWLELKEKVLLSLSSTTPTALLQTLSCTDAQLFQRPRLRTEMKLSYRHSSVGRLRIVCGSRRCSSLCVFGTSW